MEGIPRARGVVRRNAKAELRADPLLETLVRGVKGLVNQILSLVSQEISARSRLVGKMRVGVLLQPTVAESQRFVQMEEHVSALGPVRLSMRNSLTNLKRRIIALVGSPSQVGTQMVDASKHGVDQRRDLQ